MTARDYEAFGAEFRRLSAALGAGYKQAPGEIDAKIDAYFHVLKAHPIEDVKAKADTWLQTQTKMPKPAEWAGVIVRRAVEVPVLSDREAREWRQAELSRWQADPCGCPSCVEAGVNEKPLRYAPIFDGDQARQVKEPLSGRIVTAGTWLHGWPLFRWYDARATFYDTCLRLGLRGDVLNPTPKKRAKFHERMKEVFPERETA